MKIVTEGAILFWIWCVVFGATATAAIILGWKAVVGLVAGMGMVLLAAALVNLYDQEKPEQATEDTHDCNEHAW